MESIKCFFCIALAWTNALVPNARPGDISKNVVKGLSLP